MLNLARIPAGRWYGRLLRWPLSLLPAGATVRVVQGPLRGARWIIGSHTHGCWLGTYEWTRQQAMVAVVRPGMVVYDLGANVGFYTLLAARLVGPAGLVVAFEPLARNLEYLRRHLALNGSDNVTVIDAAVSDRVGCARLRGEHGASARLGADGEIAVRTVTLDELVFGQGRRPPSVIKMDVEGAEVDVLRGAERTLAVWRPILLLSTHNLGLRQECHAMLTAAGYSLRAEGNGGPAVLTDEVIAMPPPL